LPTGLRQATSGRSARTAYPDGATLALGWYHLSATEQPGSALLYLHGGGMIFGLEPLGNLLDVIVRA
jgi:acetyl esterase/lipase